MTYDREKRLEVQAMYPESEKWAKRVTKMSDEQVFAIWIRNATKNDNPPEPKRNAEDNQLPLFDEY